ncbi:MAG: hypothetical protein PHD97_07360, partial [Bacteroidales bacterium]|nr:hypothetical protein [Bacteroidales bacterium]
YGKADTALDYVTKNKPDLLQGWLLRARTNNLIDSLPKLYKGLAKPYFDKVVELAKLDSAKYNKELFEAYGEISFFFYKKMISSKGNRPEEEKNACEAKKYYEKILAIEPKNEQSISGLKIIKQSYPALKCEDKQ